MRSLGKTGIKVNRLGFGGIPIQRVSKEQSIEFIQKVKLSGINFIDTARGYSISEEYIGEAIKNNKYDFYVATKSMARDYESMKNDIETSLKNLQREYIDLYQFHNIQIGDFDKVMSNDGAYRALKEAKEQGKIKHIGATTHSLESFDKILEMGIEYFETIQFPFNIVESQGMEHLKKAHEAGMGTIIMKPLAGGAIENSDIAIKYVLSMQYVDVIIPGMAELEELESNVNSANMILKSKLEYQFSAKEITQMEEIRKDLGDNFCRRCGYCKPCPQGIDIPMAFLAGRYMKKYKLADWGNGRFQMSHLEQDGKYACISCNACLSKCPYYLHIPEMLKEVYLTKIENDRLLK